MRDLDIVLFGASGFTGRCAAEHLLETYGARGDLRWGLAGRNPSKLASLAASLGAPDLPQVRADVEDPASLRSMASRAAVVATTVGPYQRYGAPLVRACAAVGTDYVDITGEPLWVRDMLAYDEAARASGARIVPFCGFDSIPFDLGVWLLQRQATVRAGAPCSMVRGRVRRLHRGVRGGMSGGSLATLAQTLAAIQANPANAEALSDPFLLTPGFRGPPQPDGATPYRDARLGGAWVVPFMMATVNTKVIHRSNLLQGHAWGEGFLYEEMQLAEGPPGASPALPSLTADPGRPPAPGEGPSRADRQGGAYDLLFLGEGADGRSFSLTVSSALDASAGSTAALLAESAVCLARDVDREETPGGIWTPASAMGEALRGRLEAHASLRFAIEEPAADRPPAQSQGP